jgi:ABC-type glycerol-3-phosphate transport system substrate-binding protein
VAARNPQITASAEELDTMVPWSSFPGPNSDQISQILNNELQAALLLTKSPQQALDQAAAQALPLLKAT